MRSILKFNFTSLMFSFLELISKKLPPGGTEGKWGNIPNHLLEVEIAVFTNIQAISTLVCLQLDDNWFSDV